MATRLSGSLTAANDPSVVFTAYEDFYLQMDHTAGASTVALQIDLADTSSWFTTDTWTADDVVIVEVPVAAKFRIMITSLDTGPVAWLVYGKLNANDTIGGFSPGAVELEEGGDQALEEDGTSIVYEEAA